MNDEVGSSGESLRDDDDLRSAQILGKVACLLGKPKVIQVLR